MDFFFPPVLPKIAEAACGKVWSKRKLTRPHFNCVIFEYIEMNIL